MSVILVIGIVLVYMAYLFVGSMFFCGYISDNAKARADVVFENAVSYLKISDVELPKEDFLREKAVIGDIRSLSGLNALYTIKLSNDGSPVYAAASFKDGSGRENLGMGNRISDVEEFALSALSGEKVNQKINLYGEEVYLFIYPIKDEISANVAEALAMEFETKSISEYIQNKMFLYIPLIIVVLILLVFICVVIFNKLTNRAIEELTFIDGLTTLKNRAAYEEHLSKLNKKISDNIGTDLKIFTAVFNIDDLRTVNETFGNDTGDKYIKSAAEVITESFSGIGRVYRIGSDEFAMIAENCDDETLKNCIDKYEKAVSEAAEKNSDHTFSISYGYSGFVNGSDVDLSGTVKRAAEKMNRKKRDRKNKSMRVPR